MNTIEYKEVTTLENFKAWSGGADRLKRIIELDKLEVATDILNDMLEGCEEVTATTINDALWFSFDDFIEEWEEENE